MATPAVGASRTSTGRRLGGSAVPRGGVRPARPRVRLTRRGRVVLVLLFAMVSATTALTVATASRAAHPPGAPVIETVRPGDTLWSLAERHLPEQDRITTVEKIREINGLEDYTLRPGQEIVLPVRRDQ